MRVFCPGRIGIWSAFVEGGKPENPEKTKRDAISNDLEATRTLPLQMKEHFNNLEAKVLLLRLHDSN